MRDPPGTGIRRSFVARAEIRFLCIHFTQLALERAGSPGNPGALI